MQRVKVKICGITRPEDARHAVELGAWAIGLIFHAPSSRSCTPAVAEEIAAEVRRHTEIAGVFVNRPLDEVAALADRCSLSILQLHGDEGPAYCREAGRRTGARVMKAVRVRDASTVRALAAWHVDLHLLDAHVDGARGGTGETFNWELAGAHSGRVPLVLSGGLTADNVGAGIAAVRPFAVDTASGTEAAPGRKDPAKVTAFFRAVEVASARLETPLLSLDEPRPEAGVQAAGARP
ncbi:MAG: Phosphoribosylanthranilate isomerase [uncultured Solirubrobacterales bacterium]|uniref:N-(5'-phosphoribosyl)anthranilate isomerase n=1 Tax=uncultured Solirubrobacterales bacterium TaxID=768556 RepID=A0A6J4SQS6_9ACTN|nr:MAG: Phosphoribosylanthranilate isomerase [uncultured Solirubrobacterales bacterium]